MSAFSPALVDPAVLEISLLYLGFVDDDVIPLLFSLFIFSFFFFVCFPSLTTPSSTLYVSYSTYLASLI